jgi:hypothetical protein
MRITGRQIDRYVMVIVDPSREVVGIPTIEECHGN